MPELTGTPIDQINQTTINALKAVLGITETTISSKWRYYKAILSLSIDNILNARVSNQDDPNYLGDISWEYIGTGYYVGTLADAFSGIIYDSGLNIPSTAESHPLQYQTWGDYSWALKVLDKDSVELTCFAQNFTAYVDLTLNNWALPIDIAVRRRGEAPIPLSAETDVTGSKIIITFDKEMGQIGPGIINGSNFSMIRNNNITPTDPFNIINYNSINKGINGHTLEFIIDPGMLIQSTDNALSYMYAPLFFNGEEWVESFDYGLLDYHGWKPIINNMPA